MTELTIPLVLFLFALAYSPGPGNLFFAANGARFGFASTIAANLGYHVATWLVTAVIGFGFSALASHAVQFFDVMKLAGSAYVIYLAYKLLKTDILQDSDSAKTAGFMDGAILLLLNPKAYVIIALMFTQFLGKSESVSGTVYSVLWITTVFTLNNMIAFSLWAIVGDRIAAKFRDDTSARKLNFFFGICLALVGLWILLG